MIKLLKYEGSTFKRIVVALISLVCIVIGIILLIILKYNLYFLIVLYIPSYLLFGYLNYITSFRNIGSLVYLSSKIELINSSGDLMIDDKSIKEIHIYKYPNLPVSISSAGKTGGIFRYINYRSNKRGKDIYERITINNELEFVLKVTEKSDYDLIQDIINDQELYKSKSIQVSEIEPFF